MVAQTQANYNGAGMIYDVFWSKITGLVDGFNVELVEEDQVRAGLYEGMDIGNTEGISTLHDFGNLETLFCPQSMKCIASPVLTQHCISSLWNGRKCSIITNIFTIILFP